MRLEHLVKEHIISDIQHMAFLNIFYVELPIVVPDRDDDAPRLKKKLTKKIMKQIQASNNLTNLIISLNYVKIREMNQSILNFITYHTFNH